ncbi:hypothetical protein SC1_01992 [Sphingopyxis sp. C-1]|nr:hypothetical protein SC1_01992 [Sphingopyxis sp. C-1]
MFDLQLMAVRAGLEKCRGERLEADSVLALERAFADPVLLGMTIPTQTHAPAI